jgi:hypothetical protein
MASLDSGKNLLNLGIQLREFQGEYAFARMQDEIERTGQLKQMLPHQRTHAPANAIPHHRPAQHLANGKANPWPTGTVTLTIKSHHVPGKMLSTLLVHHLKVSMLQETRVPGEAL